jgi:hypothetical protein
VRHRADPIRELERGGDLAALEALEGDGGEWPPTYGARARRDVVVDDFP